jgi:N-acylneuraminate cytidylyltransferase
MTIGAIIPARGGSKGIPGKNLRIIAGRPLVAHAIHAALNCGRVDRVAVSTDDPMIAAAAQAAGAEIIWRPAELSGDAASSEDALLHGLDTWRQGGFTPDYLLFLQCTSPLTEAKDVENLIDHALASNADTAFTGVATHRFIWKEDPTGNWIGINHDKANRPRRQDREREIMENGAGYLIRTKGFLEKKHRFFGKTVCWELPAYHGIEIDEELDLQLLHHIAEHQLAKNRRTALPSSIEAIIFDFDGIFTDNRVHLSQSGEETVICSRGDGLALSRFKKIFPGKLLVLSTETNPVVLRRCEKLGLPCLHGLAVKEQALLQWFATEGVNPTRTVYLGNDLNDLGCMKLVGCPVAVADAHPEAKAHASIVLTRRGGDDAVRELLNLIPTVPAILF